MNGKREGSHSYQLPKRSLSARELQICTLLADGLSLKEIASQLNISIHTVNSHTRKAYEKLHVHNRAELATRLAQRTAARQFIEKVHAN